MQCYEMEQNIDSFVGVPNVRHHFQYNFYYILALHRKVISRASLVAQWLRIRLSMQGTRV